MEDYAACFQAHWQDFLSRLTGQIRRSGGNHLPSFTQMQVILRALADDWVSSETRWGRWLMALEKEDARKAALIQQILLSDMHFDPLSTAAGKPPYLQAAIPAAGALAGVGLSYFLHAPSWAVILSALGAGAILIPAGKRIGDASGERAIQQGAAAYLDQLEKYAQSIQSILQS